MADDDSERLRAEDDLARMGIHIKLPLAKICPRARSRRRAGLLLPEVLAYLRGVTIL